MCNNIGEKCPQSVLFSLGVTRVQSVPKRGVHVTSCYSVPKVPSVTKECMLADIKRSDIENWIKSVPEGEFHYKDIMGLRSILTPELDRNLRKAVHDFCHQAKPICENVGRRDGIYRPIDELPEPVDWQAVDTTRDFPIVLPFDLRKYVWIDPETHIIVTGSKDSGKTGLILRIVAMNMLNMNTVLLSNMEGGRTQLKRRFDAMDIQVPNPPPFKTWMKADNFHDYMKESDTLYAIDYIDVPEGGEFYMIAPAIAKIQMRLQQLGNCVAVIGLQKKRGSDTAYGGEQTLKKATLYLAMNPGFIKIVSAKIHADPKVDPKNMQWTFTYSDEGTRFDNVQPYYGE